MRRRKVTMKMMMIPVMMTVVVVLMTYFACLLTSGVIPLGQVVSHNTQIRIHVYAPSMSLKLRTFKDSNQRSCSLSPCRQEHGCKVM